MATSSAQAGGAGRLASAQGWRASALRKRHNHSIVKAAVSSTPAWAASLTNPANTASSVRGTTVTLIQGIAIKFATGDTKDVA
jgi:hypothetical protein